MSPTPPVVIPEAPTPSPLPYIIGGSAGGAVLLIAGIVIARRVAKKRAAAGRKNVSKFDAEQDRIAREEELAKYDPQSPTAA